MKRWICAYGNSQMIEEPTGNYVHIDDHEETLRACEARVREESHDRCFGKDGDMGQHEWLEAKGYAEGWEKGGAAALDAAHDAVMSLHGDPRNVGFHQMKRDALAAIDALRGES